jgi:hypothetical protein
MSQKRACASTIFSLLLGSVLTGCASVRVDEQGRTHVAGLVWLTLPAGSGVGVAANVIRTRSVGVSLNRSPDAGSLTIGYSDQTLATIYNNSVVRLPPVATNVEEER